MNTDRPSRLRYLVWITAGMLLVLTLLPFTGWIVRRQLKAAAGLSPAGQAEQKEARRQTARRRADDYPMQLAHALAGSGPPAERLRVLEPRFGDRPSLHANTLRTLARSGFHVDRDEENLLGSQPSSGVRRGSERYPPTAEQLAAFDQAAARGEQLDPNNAFFPFLRAAGLFAAKQDDAALDAVLRAGQKPRWDEYTIDEVDGAWRLTEAAYGEAGAISRVAQSAALLFPHCALLRSAARIATAKAVEAEQAGDFERGFRIRHAVARCGSRMRVQSTSLIGSLVGTAVSSMAMSRPGGAPLIPRSVPQEERPAKRLAAYATYLERIGRPDEARWIKAELAAGAQGKAICRLASDKSVYSVETLARLVAWSGASLYTLISAFWMFGLGGLAALLYRRSPGLRNGEPLSSGARRAIGLGFTVVLVVLVSRFWAVALRSPAATIPEFALLLLLTVAPVAMLLTHARRGFFRVWATTVGTLCALGGIALWQAHVGVETIQGFQTFVSYEQNVADNTYALMQMVVALGVLAVPVFVASALAIASRIVRVPAAAGVTRGLRGLAVPIGCGLLLLYGALALGTAREEAQAINASKRMVQHEGRYLAEIAGQPWPGEVR